MPQQKLAQPAPGLELILLGGLPCPHQVPQRLMSRVWNPHRRQLPSSVTASQSLRIAAVRLYPVPCLGGNQTGGDYLTLHSQLRQLPIEHIPSWPSFIAGPQMLNRTEFVNQFANRFQPVGNRANRTNLSFRFRHRDGDGFGMDIQTNTLYFRHSD